jgi:tetratricopeptide (TPR) repeat protein
MKFFTKRRPRLPKLHRRSKRAFWWLPLPRWLEPGPRPPKPPRSSRRAFWRRLPLPQWLEPGPRPPKPPRSLEPTSWWSLSLPWWLKSGPRPPKVPRAVKLVAPRRKLTLPPWQVMVALMVLFVTGGIFVAAVAGVAKPQVADFEGRYVAAREAGDWTESVIWLRRQLLVDPMNLESRMRLIEAYAALNDSRAVLDLVNQIAPADAVVYGPAHLFRARLLLAGGSADPKARDAAKVALALARSADPAKGQGVVGPEEVAELMIEVLVAEGDWAGALEAAREISAPSPETRLLLANAMKNLGWRREATVAATEAAAEITAREPQTALEERLARTTSLVQAAFVKDKIDDAVKLVLAAGNAPEFGNLQARVLYQAAVTHRTESSLNASAWLECVVKGLAVRPEDYNLTNELLIGAGVWKSFPGFAEKTRRRLSEAGLDAHSELLAATASIVGRKPGEAFVQFRNAWTLLPGNPLIANNYAYLLAFRQTDAAPTKALAIIEGVLESDPDVAEFLDTKGRILLRLERFDEAVATFERALARGADRITHRSLAEAYDGLGQTELAETHRQLAEER